MTGRDFSLEDAHGIGSLSEAEASKTPRKPYERINQRDVDDQSKQVAQKNPLKSLPSLGFVLATLSCVALAIVTYNTNPLGEDAGGYDHDVDQLLTLDCTRIQTIGAGQFLTSRLLNIGTANNAGPTDVPQFELTFSIDIRTHPTLTFLQVKVIDVMWNLIVGQGVKLLMGYITYIVCSKGIVLLVRRWRVSYGFYVSVGLQGTSLMSAFQAAKDLFYQPSRRSLRDWLIVLWIILGMSYTLSIPSLLSAATGYTVPTDSWWKMPDQSLVSNLTTALRGCWLVQDGPRIGLEQGAFVSGPEYEALPGFLGEEDSSPSCQNYTTEYPLFDSVTHYYCDLIDLIKTSRNLSEPDGGNLASVYNNASTTILINNTDIDLPAPPLDLGNGHPTNFTTLDSFPRIRRCYNNQVTPFTVGDEYCLPPLRCVSAQELYSWGFSKNLSFSILIAQAIWCLTTWFMWLYVTNMLRKLKWETPGVFQAAFALADAVREDLGENANVLSEKQLGDVLAKKQGISSEHIRKRRSIQMDGLRRRGSESSF